MPAYEYETYKPFDPDFAARVAGIFHAAPFINDLGLLPVSVAAGSAVTECIIQRKHQQQNGFIHAGVLATIADHTGGALQRR